MMTLLKPLKIMMFGTPGSGKSTFACILSTLTNIPVYHLDYYFYLPNWVERDYQEFLDIQRSIVETNQWIIDGNNTKSLEIRYKQADFVLYFNYPRIICYWRVFKRFVMKRKTINDRAPCCPENIRWCLLKYMWHFKKKAAPIIKKLQKDYPHIHFLEICSDNDLKKVEKHFVEITENNI